MRILLVSHKFPPYPYVGAHRWTKLAKYMARHGAQLDVLTLDWGEPDADVMADVTHPNIRIHRLRSFAPHRALAYRNGRTVGGRALDRLAGIARHAEWLGVADEPYWWRLSLVPEIVRVLRSDAVDAVVATGPPYLPGYWAAHAKHRAGRGVLVQEFRDLWMDRLELADPKPRLLARARAREEYALGAADAFVTVGDDLAETVRRRHPELPSYVIPNGFDPEEFSYRPPITSAHMHAVHVGQLYSGRERPLAALLGAIRSSRDLVPGLRLSFYGGFPASVRREYADLERSGILDIHDHVPRQDIPGIIAGASVCLQFNGVESPGARSTKIYEYAAVGRPTISINYGGEIARLIEEHDLGWNANGDEQESIVKALLDAQALWQSGRLDAWRPSGIEEYSHERLAADYLAVLEETVNRAQATS